MRIKNEQTVASVSVCKFLVHFPCNRFHAEDGRDVIISTFYQSELFINIAKHIFTCDFYHSYDIQVSSSRWDGCISNCIKIFDWNRKWRNLNVVFMITFILFKVKLWWSIEVSMQRCSPQRKWYLVQKMKAITSAWGAQKVETLA